MVAVTVRTAAHGWPNHAIRLAATLFRYLDVGGYFPEAITIHGHARHAASQIGDRCAEAGALTSLGLANLEQGRHQEASSRHGEALALFRETSDRAGQARALGQPRCGRLPAGSLSVGHRLPAAGSDSLSSDGR